METVEQARHVVSCVKFGTANNGTRSAPPCRLFPGLEDTPLDAKAGLHKSLNNQAAVMIQIESLAAIQNLDAILAAVPDIDIVFLGMLDCRVSMNMKGGFGVVAEEPEWLESLALFKDTLKKHDKPWARYSFAAEPFRKEVDGMSVCFVTFDVMALMAMNDQLVAARAAAESLVRKDVGATV